MTANSYLQVTELDFSTIKNNLKSFLSTQNQFADYDFEGSAINVLLDILAYNTHYGAYYLNMIGNEMFLDTAQQRDSVVSRSKELGYLTTSAQGPTANVHLVFNGIANNVTQFTLPKNSRFKTTIDDTTYTFVTTEAHRIVNSANTFIIDVPIKEGRPLTHRFVVNANNPVRYIIPNKNVDVNSIKVTVQASASDTTSTEFVRATNILEVSTTTPIYYIEEVDNEKFEIIFSLGVLGKPVINGNIIIVEYLVCNAHATNGANIFVVDSVSIDPAYNSITVTTNSKAVGGRNIESIESIKFNAPKSYQTQNRAVVAKDFERIILAENADVQSIIAYGGEEASPPVYGKVYIAIKPFGEEYLTFNRKLQIESSIQNRTSLAIDPQIIDPTYTYIIPTVTSYYDTTSSTQTRGEIENLVRSAIDSYSENNLERFGNKLRYSRFVRSLDNITNSILNNEASIKIQSRLVPDTNRARKYTINFNNSIRVGTVESSQFTYSGFNAYLRDDSLGNLDIYRFNDAKEIVNIVSGIGTVNYTTGQLDIENFAPTAYVDIVLKISAIPTTLDVVPVREQILIMNSSDATIIVVGEN